MVVVAPWSVPENRRFLLQLFGKQRIRSAIRFFPAKFDSGASCPSLTGVVCFVFRQRYAFTSHVRSNQNNLQEWLNIRLIFYTDDYLFVQLPKQVCYLIVQFRHLPIWHLFKSLQIWSKLAAQKTPLKIYHVWKWLFASGSTHLYAGSTRPYKSCQTTAYGA